MSEALKIELLKSIETLSTRIEKSDSPLERNLLRLSIAGLQRELAALAKAEGRTP